MNSHLKFTLGWSALVGAMDGVTGLLLIYAPAGTLAMLGIAPPPAAALVFVKWIGVFVAAVGLSYGLALLNPRHGGMVWAVTALVRILVGVFVVWQISAGELAIPWAVVAVTDLLVAGVQVALLRAGWWEVPRR